MVDIYRYNSRSLWVGLYDHRGTSQLATDKNRIDQSRRIEAAVSQNHTLSTHDMPQNNGDSFQVERDHSWLLQPYQNFWGGKTHRTFLPFTTLRFPPAASSQLCHRPRAAARADHPSGRNRSPAMRMFRMTPILMVFLGPRGGFNKKQQSRTSNAWKVSCRSLIFTHRNSTLLRCPQWLTLKLQTSTWYEVPSWTPIGSVENWHRSPASPRSHPPGNNGSCRWSEWMRTLRPGPPRVGPRMPPSMENTSCHWDFTKEIQKFNKKT